MARALTSERPWAEEEPLSLEVRALLVCSQSALRQEGSGRLKAVVATCTSADRLAETAVVHGMLGHLHRALTAEEPIVTDTALSRRLSELQRASALRNLRQTAVLLRILELLEAARVQVMPMRGPVWAQSLYGDIALRNWADLDLLVPHEQVRVTRDVLMANGFCDCGKFNEKSTRPHWGSTGQIALYAPETEVYVDVHWTVGASVGTRVLTLESVFARADHLQLLGREVPCPGRTDAFLMTCLEGARDSWRSVSRLLDLAVQIERTSVEEWPGLIHEARAVGCARRLRVSVFHACRVFGLLVPPPIVATLDADGVGRLLARSLRPSGLTGVLSEGLRERMRLLLWHTASEDRWLDGLNHSAIRLLAPTVEDWERFALPPRMEWLYYLLRPGRLAAKWLGHFLSVARKQDSHS